MIVDLRARDVVVAAWLVQPFTLYLFVMRWLAPATAANWRRADPILGFLPHDVVLWLVPVLGVVAVAVWTSRARPARAELGRALRDGALGAVVAVLIAVTLRLVWGSTLPTFIPSEESAGPGALLSMTAGYGEEIVFRLALLPSLYLLLRRRASPNVSVALAVLATGLAFAVAHQLGPGASPPAYFATRFLFPGCVMSVVFLRVSPTFLVVAHCTAHLLMPLLFV